MTNDQIEPTNIGTLRGGVNRSLSAVSTGTAAARRTAGRVARRIPRTIRATRSGATGVTSALQALPDPTLRTLAASSAGLGAGLYFTGASRLVVIAGVVPAVLAGAAIALRPVEPVVPLGQGAPSPI